MLVELWCSSWIAARARAVSARWDSLGTFAGPSGPSHLGTPDPTITLRRSSDDRLRAAEWEASNAEAADATDHAWTRTGVPTEAQSHKNWASAARSPAQPWLDGMPNWSVGFQ
jgi:hypothetical protein